jgi:hypothetical protein
MFTFYLIIGVALGIFSFWQKRKLDKEIEGRDLNRYDGKLYATLSLGIAVGAFMAVILIFKFFIWLIKLTL